MRQQSRFRVLRAVVALALLLFGMSVVHVPAKATPPAVQFSATAGPWVNLGDGQALPLSAASAATLATERARPRSLAAADFNADGAPDLVAGYATETGGQLACYPGNASGPESRDPVAFTTAPSWLALPGAPDFLGAGDFNADGLPDLVAAMRGGEALWFLPGNGAGNFGALETLKLPGALTALAAGELYRQDGLADLAMGIETPTGAQVLVFAGKDGAQAATPEVFDLSAPVVALAIGQLDDAYPFDIAIAAGKTLVVLHGYDHLEVEKTAPTLETFALNFAPISLALGDFRIGDEQAQEIALLGADGQVRIADNRGRITQHLSPNSQLITHNSQLIRIKSSSLPTDDLLVLGEHQAAILTADGQRMTPEGDIEQAVAPGTLAIFSAAAPLAAALPLRLNGDGLDDLVLLTEGAPTPTVMLTMALRTFTVNSPADLDDNNPGDGKCETVLLSGMKVCTFRGALQEANASTGNDEIEINIQRGYWSSDSIRPGSAFPDITETVSIRDVVAGFKQVIDGRNMPAGVGLHIRSNNVYLDDLTFTNFTATSNDNPVIKISTGGGNRLYRCQIGPSNAGLGVQFTTAANRIDRSVIAGNSIGILVSGGSGNIIGPENFIGRGISGSNASNAKAIDLNGATNTKVGDVDPLYGVYGGPNIISGNTCQGVLVQNISTNGTLILKNTIGLNATGDQALGNGCVGIYITGGAAATTIGNNTETGRNVISANSTGILINQAYDVGVSIRGNYIGVNATATAAIANATNGIWIDTLGVMQVEYNTIGGAPTSDDGIKIQYLIAGTRAHQINHNRIGTNAAGTNLGNGKNGISLLNMRGAQLQGNTIRYNGQSGITTQNGGQFTISNNTVLGNGGHGIDIDGSGSTVTNNTIGYNGANRAGILVSGNNNTLSNNIVNNDIQSMQFGISVQGSGNTVSNSGSAQIGGGDCGVMLDGSNNTLTGYTIRDAYTGIRVSGANNIIGPSNRIHGNFIGIGIESAASGTQVRGNTLGVDATGNVAAPNYDVGIAIGGTNTTLGGSNASDGNVISGGGSYGAAGVRIWGGNGATVRNNKIGVGADGTTPLGNLTGIHIIGGTQSSIQDNLIAYNGTGVLVEQGTQHNIIGNSIHSNGALGIDLSPAGVTLNDSGDGDTGANNLQNFPVLTLAGIVGSSTRAVGMLDSLPSRTYTIRLYSNPTCHYSGHGEGRTYLGQGTVNTNAGGQANIDLTVGVAATLGHRLTATATDPDGNTSEFSACSGPLGVLGADTFTVNALGDAVDNNLTDGICDSSAAPGEQCTLRAAIQQANANTGANRILLPAGTYPLTLAGSDNVAAVGDLDIIDELLLIGAGANVTIIKSEVTDRVFEIRNNTTVDIVGVTVKGGNLTTSANGAGILVNSGTTLYLDAVSVQENQTASGSGGGIYSAGTLTLSGGAVISNTAGGETNGGGGIFVLGGVTTLRNSTISGNQSKGNGGGIQNLAGTVRLNNVTVAYNTADSDNDGGDGGGLYNLNTFEVKNSIVAANVDLSAGGYPYGQADCSGTFTTQGYNLIADKAQQNNANPPACAGFGGTGNYDSVGGFWLMTNYLRYAAGLGPLQLNGGTTLNHSPYSAVGWTVDRGSPATPGSGDGACELFDQRGQPRPIDGGTDGIAVCDRGAVELIPSYLSIGDATVAEGSPAVFNVTLSAAAQITFTVQYSTTNITAIAGQDYTHVAGTLTFTPGQSAQTIQVSTLTDTYNEDTETFRVRLYWPSYVLIADGEGIGTINDGSLQPALLINDRTVTEGDAGSSVQATFTASLNSASGKTVTVDYTTVDGTALAGEDYATTQGQLSFAPGVTSRTISVNIIGDNVKEGNETFTVQLSNPVNATIGDASGLCTITDDDTPAFSIYDASLEEGSSGTSPMAFIVELSKPSTQPITVNYITSPGTAKSGSDYIHTGGTLTFAAGETLKTIAVQIVGDDVDEPNEIFYVALNTPTGGTVIARGTATGMILDVGGSRVFLPLVIRN